MHTTHKKYLMKATMYDSMGRGATRPLGRTKLGCALQTCTKVKYKLFSEVKF